MTYEERAGRAEGAVLTIRKITVAVGDGASAGRAAGYVLDVSAEPATNAVWLGSDAALGTLGLERGSPVEAHDLALALQGRDVEGGQVRKLGRIKQVVVDETGAVRRDPEGTPLTERRLGVASYDLTFSVPKSVSVVWSQAGPELRVRIENAVMAAANEVLAHMTQTKAVVMAGRDADGQKVYLPARGFAAAAALHVTARRARDEAFPAPQLHVHGMLVGVERADGELAGVHSSAMFMRGAALEGGAVGRAKLAELLREIGFEIESGTGRGGLYFEVRGVRNGLVTAMSGRTREIEAAATRMEGELGRPLTSRERASLATLTRASRESSPSAEAIRAAWDALGEEFDFGPAEVMALLERESQPMALEARRSATTRAVEQRFAERGPTVSTAQARAIVYGAAAGRLSLREAHELLEDLERGGTLVALDGDLVTTAEIRSMERRVIDVVTRASERQAEPVSPAALSGGIALAQASVAPGRVDGEQLKAIEALSRGNGWSVLTGRAGTGKTPVLQAVAEAHRRDGGQVVACAIDWNTAQKLGEDVGAPRPQSIRTVIAEERAGRLLVDRRTLILIDEAGKVGTREWAGLAKLVDSTGARVLAVGHAGQLDAIELPGMFDEMVLRRKSIPVVELQHIRRHRHEWMRDYQIAVDEGRGKKAVGILRRQRAIKLHATRADATDALVETWDEARREHGTAESVLIVHGSNADVDHVNRLAQWRRQVAGDLRGEAVASPDRDYGFHEGDMVVLRDAPYHPRDDERVENGTVGEVVGVDVAGRRMWVQVREPGQDERRVEVDLRRRTPPGQDELVPSWRLSYARHVNQTQGATLRAVVVLGGHWSQARQETYTSDSRQKLFLFVHIDRESLGGGTDAQVWATYARRVRKSRKRLASIRYKKTPATRVAGQLAKSPPVPELPRAEVLEPEQPTELEVPDPLAPYRRALGEQHADAIEGRSHEHAEEASRLHIDMLRVERAATREALERLDRAGALETHRLHRDQVLTRQRSEEALRLAADLEAQARELAGRRHRVERRDLLEAAATQRDLGVRDAEELERLNDEERRLRLDGRHVDDWVADESETAAWFVALEREYSLRREWTIERAVAQPSEELVSRLGPMPKAGSQSREAWMSLARELERDRLMADSEPGYEGLSQSEQRELEHRIDGLRGLRSLEGEAPAQLER